MFDTVTPQEHLKLDIFVELLLKLKEIKNMLSPVDRRSGGAGIPPKYLKNLKRHSSIPSAGGYVSTIFHYRPDNEN